MGSPSVRPKLALALAAVVSLAAAPRAQAVSVGRFEILVLL